MIENDHVVLWNRCLNIIRDNVPDTTYKTWFEPIVPLKYEDHALTIGVPSPFFYELGRVAVLFLGKVRGFIACSPL